MKILLVKLGALGDVLRTTPLLTALKLRYPDSEITWVVDPKCADVLENNPLVDRIICFDRGTPKKISSFRFDLAINLDKDAEALDTVMAAQAEKKIGFGRSKDGLLCALDAASDYAYRLGIDDHLKFHLNKKTYQEISFEQVGLDFRGEEYLFAVDPESERFIGKHLKALGFPAHSSEANPVIGINTGSGHRFAGKRLPVETFAQLAERCVKELNATVLLLGGKDEIPRNKEIEKRCTAKVINTGSHSIRRFAAIVKRCSLIVTGDTTAMHIAIAVKVPVVAYFASTCAQEIELYGRGKKIVSDIACAPCYKRICPIDEQCMKDMKTDELLDAVREILNRVGATLRVARSER